MGKSFANFMCKKDFHPASKSNIKKVWMAEQKISYDKKKQEELMQQYLKEQESYDNRLLMGDERVKNGLNFMYEAPPGAKKENKEVRYYFLCLDLVAIDCNLMEKLKDFLMNVFRKKKQKERLNTNLNGRKEPHGKRPSMHPSELIAEMRNSGFALKRNVLGRNLTANDPSQEYVASEGEEDPEVEFLKSLTTKQKQKLLRKLDRLEKKKKKKKKDRKKKKLQKSRSKHRKHKNKSPSSSSSTSSSSSSSSETSESNSESDNKEKKIQKKKRKKNKCSGNNNSDSEEKDQSKKRKLYEELSSSHHHKEKPRSLKPECSRENSKRSRSDSDRKSRSPEKRGPEGSERSSRSQSREGRGRRGRSRSHGGHQHREIRKRPQRSPSEERRGGHGPRSRGSGVPRGGGPHRESPGEKRTCATQRERSRSRENKERLYVTITWE
uniref:Corepressor interacting with RBPJ, 1 n=1 Tax=Suricata suricatta TaxID=37032 RepID=A0A673VT29_SURSU